MRTTRPHPLGAAILACAAVYLGGCFTVDLTLKSDGSGTLEYGYGALPKMTEASEKARFTSPEFTPESVTLTAGKPAVVKGAFQDVTKLPKAEAFKLSTVTRTKDGDTETLSVTLTNPDPRPTAQPGTPDPRITITLPGKVLEARPTGEVTDQKVAWKIPVADLYTNKKLELVVKYQVPKG